MEHPACKGKVPVSSSYSLSLNSKSKKDWIRPLTRLEINSDMMHLEEANNNLQRLFSRLAKSKFRSSFKLGKKDRVYLQQKGWMVIEKHARDFVKERLAPALPKNDGKQTPMKKHPVFIAQHATATCCRKCLAKWHRIAIGKELNQKQVNYIVSMIMYWLRRSNINEYRSL